MSVFLRPEEIERRARRARLSIRELCGRAGIARSTFWRWKQGASPNTLTHDRLMRVIDDAEREAEAASAQ